MESALASRSPHLIEYPADLSGCSTLPHGGRELLYLCSQQAGSTHFVVVLGYFSGQKNDVITKDLIEPVAESDRSQVSREISRTVPAEYSGAHIFFL
ncbi:MAG TPA: hypothetical protein VIB07_09085 [Nitrososphaera sp.]|jgi:hypothetical protein